MKALLQEHHVIPTAPRTRRRAETGATSGPSDNFTKTPNELDHLLFSEKLSGLVQMRIIWLIQRRTWGDAKRPEWARISTREMASACLTDKKNLAAALTDLVSRGIIAVQESNGCDNSAKFYKVTYENWKEADVYTAPAKPKQEAEPEDEATGELEAKESNVIVPTKQPLRDRLRLRPGRTPARVPLKLNLERIEYACEGKNPVEISTQASSDGVLFVTVFSELPTRNQGEEKVKGGGVHTPSCQTPTEQNQRLTDFTCATSEILLSEFRKGFDPADRTDQKFLADVMEAAGPDLPAPEFLDYCRTEIHAMRRARKPVVSGILVAFARQAAKLRASALATTGQRPATQPDGASDPAWLAYLEQLKIEDPEGYALVTRDGIR